MLRLIMNQTSHIMMLVEGTSLSVNQWDQKLRNANWTLNSSDDRHHWVGVRTASSGTSITPLVDNCGSVHQKIWYAIFDNRVLKVALQPWPTLAGLKALTGFGVNGVVFDSYFRADSFCKYNHDDDDDEFRHKLRKTAI